MDSNQGEALKVHVGKDNMGSSVLSQSKLESPTPSHVGRNLIDLKIDHEGGSAHPSYS